MKHHNKPLAARLADRRAALRKATLRNLAADLENAEVPVRQEG